MEDMNAEARRVLRDSSTEEKAVKNLEKLGLIAPVVFFSKPNEVGQTMKMGVAWHGSEVIYF